MKLVKNTERALNWLKFTPIVILVLTFMILALGVNTGFRFGF